jgi:Fic family protein
VSLLRLLIKVSNNTRLGYYVTKTTGDEKFKAFIPPPLPPKPTIDLNPLYPLLDKATIALGCLKGVTSILPDPGLFIYLYVRKEALLSSQIEGTQSSLSDLLLHEDDNQPSVPLDDVQEVSSYVKAMYHGLKRMKEGFPLSLRLIRELHQILLSNGRGQHKAPGDFRTSQNWIGGTRPATARFVPPPPEDLMACLGALELFIHDESQPLPLLVKAALVHVQFETIHPFLDGNGRLGRLLITFLLCASGHLTEPTLYLSLYFKQHREVYYDLLQRVRTHGAWEEWLQFFLEGVIETATQAAESAKRLLDLFEEDRKQIEGLGRAASSTLRVHYHFQKKPITDMLKASAALGLAPATISRAFKHLETLGIIKEISGKQRGQIYTYHKLIDILAQGTEPLSF